MYANSRVDLNIRSLTIIALLLVVASCCLPPRPDPSDPPAAPTTLALVQQNQSGTIQLRYVRGEALAAGASYVNQAQPVSLQTQYAIATMTRSTATAMRSIDQQRIIVARAIFPASSNTAIYVADSSYASMLAKATPRLILERPVTIDSGVYISQLNDSYYLAWREGNAIMMSKSLDTSSWSEPQIWLSPGDVIFNLWSEGNKLYLAHTNSGKDSIIVKQSLDGLTFSEQFSFTPSHVPIVDLSLATDASRILVAYASEKSIGVKCLRKNAWWRSDNIVNEAPAASPDYRFLDVSLHPSPYGWALIFNASLPTTDGITYTTFGRRSDDGVNYGQQSWTFYTSTAYRGRVDMTLTPTPMPWITKIHDSGKAAEETYNFVISGEGFRYADKDRFMQAATTLSHNIDNRAPFYYNPGAFNIWIVHPFSIDAGFDSAAAIDDKNTIFNSHRIDNTTMVQNRENAMQHAKRVIAGTESIPNMHGFVLYNNDENEPVAIPSWDMHGTPVPYRRANSQVPLHEYLHTHSGSGGFALGDHERRNQPSNQINKSFDGTLVNGGSHAWQHWFTFTGPAASRLIETTPEYKTGLLDWIANGEDMYAYQRTHFGYSEDPNSPYYVDALSLLNVGLWESELSDVTDFSLNPQYSALRACAMNSLLHHAQFFCPICSEDILAHLAEASGETFDVVAFQSASGAFVEFQSVNAMICGAEHIAEGIDLQGLLSVNGQSISNNDIQCYESHDFVLHKVCRVDISNLVSSGQSSNIVFHQRTANGHDTQLWIPGLQIVNSRGARYTMQPFGQTVIDQLHQQHAPDCAYEYWNLGNADFSIQFVPN